MVPVFTAHLCVTPTRISLTDSLFSTEAHLSEVFSLLGMLTCRAERLSACCSCVLPVILHCSADVCIPTIQPADVQLLDCACFCALKAGGESSVSLCRDMEPHWEKRGREGRLRLPFGWLWGQQSGAAVRDSWQCRSRVHARRGPQALCCLDSSAAASGKRGKLPWQV